MMRMGMLGIGPVTGCRVFEICAQALHFAGTDILGQMI